MNFSEALFQAGMLQEVWHLEEGPVTVTFPGKISPESYADLSDHIALFLRKMGRRSKEVSRG